MYGQRRNTSPQESNNLEARARRVIEEKVVDRNLLEDLESDTSLSGTAAQSRRLIVHKALDRAIQSDLDKMASATQDITDPIEDPGLVSGQKTTKPGRNGNVPPRGHRFKPGQSGNPSGRPSLSLTKMLRDLLEENDGRYAKALVRRWLHAACYSTNVHALSELLDRIEGPQPRREGEPLLPTTQSHKPQRTNHQALATISPECPHRKRSPTPTTVVLPLTL